MKTKTEVRKRNPGLISIVEIIAKHAAGSEFSSQFLRRIKEPADELSGFLGCNRVQSILFSVICNLNLSNKAVTVEQITTWMGCNPITFVHHMHELDFLLRTHILRKGSGGKKIENLNAISTLSFSVNPEVFHSLRKGMPFMKPKSEIKDSYELIKAMAGLIEQHHGGEITVKELWRGITRMDSQNTHMDFLLEIKRTLKDKMERLLLIALFNEYFGGNLNCDLIPLIKTITQDEREQVEMRFKLLNGDAHLVSKRYAEIKESVFRGEFEIRLTAKAMELLAKDNKSMVLKKKPQKSFDIIKACDIKQKSLFFTREEQDRVDFLAQVLLPSNYKGLMKRLNNSGMKQGIAVLFCGPPGTGKTESVLQMAKQTGRDIYQVTISETKSMWFGESEKRIKEVFERYRLYVEESEITPILFFNEADGIFGTRKSVGASSVDQTENTIQNILLQEMEDLKGILIATTNMTENFDKAFDRRFLYKISFEKPGTEAKYHMWKDKIPTISDVAARKFAAVYDLSGGQIDNVARKFLMSRILQGTVPSENQVESWCLEEKKGQEIKRIGY